ncbi:Glycosyltransferase [Arcticibacter svalbardensis MN12-7]|uniref:Glycosyltransferase n=1 Tax=Arcticibacter svalbardensis MN12-7 TaxID=1150600 RepID=R9GQL9_9SPHI|nr:glycosyltransferase family 4 protein [Arcticibacter svalbardensis]EOR94013.1 Glycosyltransferase [Arcticibacter svalbardensis MN12-7]
MNVWIINPYGSLPEEGWRTYRSTMIANALVKSGHHVVQFISNFEHRSKTFRTESYEIRDINPSYKIHIIPTSSYSSHISFDRIKYERSFGKYLLSLVDLDSPDVVILAEPAICYFNIIIKWIKVDLKAKLVIDLIDIWPELFHLLFPKELDLLAKVIFSPLYFWRKRLYRQADGLIAVSQNYQHIGLKIKPFEKLKTDVVYWSIPKSELSNKISSTNDVIANMIKFKHEDEVWCIYAGTLGENYDVHSIMEAGKRLSKKYHSTKFKLLVAGDGPMSEYCRKNSDGITVVFLARLNSLDLEEVFKKCDLALSTYKGRSTVSMPIKAFDYLAFGLPLINSLGRDLGHFVEKYNVGINYVPESVEALFIAICKIVDDENLRDEMRKNAFHLSESFSEDKQYAKFVSVVENV